MSFILSLIVKEFWPTRFCNTASVQFWGLLVFICAKFSQGPTTAFQLEWGLDFALATIIFCFFLDLLLCFWSLSCCMTQFQPSSLNDCKVSRSDGCKTNTNHHPAMPISMTCTDFMCPKKIAPAVLWFHQLQFAAVLQRSFYREEALKIHIL